MLPRMRVVVQRASDASVMVDGEVTGSIGTGLVVLAGVAEGDTEADVDAVADKLVGLRIFPDDENKMNRSVVDAGGEILLVSQFTLLGNVRKGRRPSFTAAAPPDEAAALVEYLAHALEERGVGVAQGRFGAMMEVRLTNDGPVTIVIDTAGGKVI